jgi:hypothetical protein
MFCDFVVSRSCILDSYSPVSIVHQDVPIPANLTQETSIYFRNIVMVQIKL